MSQVKNANSETNTEANNATDNDMAEHPPTPAANERKRELDTLAEEDKGEDARPIDEDNNDSNEKDEEQNRKRERKPTPKMKELQEEEQRKRERKFNIAYDRWKQCVKSTRSTLKQECSEADLGTLLDELSKYRDLVLQAYDTIRSNAVPNQEIKRRMDACAAVTQDIISLIHHRISEVDDEWDECTERKRLHAVLDKEYASSVYGSLMQTSIAPSSISPSSRRSSRSDAASIAAKRAEAAAELAAKKANLKAIEEEEAERVKLEQAIEAQKRGIKRLEMQREVKVAQAKMDVYERELVDSKNGNQPQSDQGSQYHSAVGDPDPHRPAPSLRPECPEFIPSQTLPALQPTLTETVSLAQALQTSLMLGRLPLPEPTIFNGDPLQYNEWKASFLSLIDSKGISAQEKFYFLKKYAGKEAGKAIQGYFLTHTEDSYKAAWKALEDRYGNPFILQRAFREKLATWPTIANKDGEGLRDFADFLQGCQKAMTQIPSLQVLHDCMENQKLMNKLPGWASTRWNRKVTYALQGTGLYPNFDSFVEFVVTEARVACNPVSSIQAHNDDKKAREPKRKQASVMATNVDSQPRRDNLQPNQQTKGKHPQKNSSVKGMTSDQENKEPLKRCPFCKFDGHYLPMCPTFIQKSMEEKRKFIQEQRRCYGCLRTGHASRDCAHKHTCKTCNRKHPTCLHDDNFQFQSTDGADNGNSGSTSAAALNTSAHKASFLTSTVVPVWVSTRHNPSHEKLVYALLDTQSNISFIDETICHTLHAESEPVNLKLTTMTQKDSDITCERVTGLRIRGYTSSVVIDIPSAYTRDLIPIDLSHVPTTETAKNWSHLRSISDEVPPLLDCDVGLLIGYNCSQALVPREVITGQDDEPFAIRSDLGWSIVGRASPTASCFNVTGLCHRTSAKESPLLTPNDALTVLERDFHDMEVIGGTISQEDLQFIQKMQDGITQLENGHYSMPLPFKRPPTFPNNYTMALTRLNQLKRKLEKNPSYHTEYSKFMDESFKRGDAEKVTEDANSPAWYIPHHGVYHPQKRKLRVVFDCSAKYQGMSLNDHLLVGPDLTNNLLGVLCRFRQNTVAVMCDIEKMFYQFEVNPEDRNFLRFLWWENGDLSSKPEVYRMKVHLFGATSSPGCANYGLKHIANANKEIYPMGATFVERYFYVDDGLISEPTEERAKQVINEATALCAKGGLRLHKFVSNSRAVMEHIPVTERASNVIDLDLSLNDLPMERALGLQWSTESDTLHFACSPTERPATRRGILATVASLYDPLGLIAPYVLRGKRILQDMCHKGTGWDDTPSQDLLRRWEGWKADIQMLNQVRIPRCYHPGFQNIQTVQLHHFSDASTAGYGMCSYLRLQNKEGDVHCALVVAKARVAPTKIITVPRLELSAALVSAEVGTAIKRELDLNVQEEFFWTDSQVVIGYINNEARKFHTFVANRVQKIRQLTRPEQWHYVPTETNPADYASRGLSAREISTTCWLSGPAFLWKKEIETPFQPTMELQSGDSEVRKTTLQTQVSRTFDWNVRLAHCSTWNSATRAVARIVRLAHRIKRKDQLSVTELRHAELLIIKGLQQQMFSEERKLLSSNHALPNTNKLYQLDPFLQDGVIHVGGRLKQADMSDGQRHPVVLPGKSHITNLIIDHHHRKSQHQGRGITLNTIRSHGYWIVGGSNIVSKRIHKCVTCRKLRRPTEKQQMADLPPERVTPSAPFTYTGMDCFGPLSVKNGRKEMKRYGLLLTCFSSRAIHMELLDDLSTDAFINGLRCFLAIRGTVASLHSDQGTNFVGAKNAFEQALKDLDTTRLNDFLTSKQCEFVFNAPAASHMGGLWERQIKTVKGILDATIKTCPGRLDDSSLRTVLYEVMAIVNSRPLTVSDQTQVVPEPLTPNHILTMKPSTPLPPPGKFVKEDLYLHKRWKRVQYLLEQFWSRWKKEYLHTISLRQKWHTPRRNLMVGDVVLVLDHDTPRNEWPLARVTEAITGNDGLVRKVKLLVGSRKLNTKGQRTGDLSVLERPIQKLILLIEAD